MTFDPQTLTWLANAFFQTTALLSMALLANFIFKRASAAVRHTPLLLTSFGIPLLLLLSAVLPNQQLTWGPQLDTFHIGVPQTETHFTQSIKLGAPLTSPDPFATPIEKITPPLPSAPQRPTLPLSTWIVGIWIVGVILCWLRLALGIASLSRIKQESHRASDSLRQALLAEVQSLNIKTPPILVALPNQAMPMTWRLSAHRLAIPASASDWPADKLRNVILHELAHIQRNDFILSCFSRFALALVWFNPLAWLLRRALHTTREAACDDLVLGRSANEESRKRYARHLLEIISTHSQNSRSSSLALAMARRTKDISRRLRAILDDTQKRNASSPRSRHLTLPLWLGSISILATVSACREKNTHPTSSLPVSDVTPSTHVKVSTKVIEFDHPDFLRKKFELPEDGNHFTRTISTDQMEDILDELGSHAGTNIHTSASLVTPINKPGTIENIREFIYPTEYDPPEVPSSQASENPSESMVPITPATPTAFEVRNLGFAFEVIPSQGEDKSMIGLDFNLSHTHFLGFINYGSPITAPSTDSHGLPTEVVLTENRIEMPVFSSHRFKSDVLVRSGHVIAMISLVNDSDSDPNLTARMTKARADNSLGDPKHTLYFVHPEFVDEP